MDRPARSRLLRKTLSFFAASAFETSARLAFVFLSAAKNGFWRTTFGLHLDGPASLIAFATKAAALVMAFAKSPAFAGAAGAGCAFAVPNDARAIIATMACATRHAVSRPRCPWKGERCFVSRESPLNATVGRGGRRRVVGSVGATSAPRLLLGETTLRGDLRNGRPAASMSSCSRSGGVSGDESRGEDGFEVTRGGADERRSARDRGRDAERPQASEPLLLGELHRLGRVGEPRRHGR